MFDHGHPGADDLDGMDPVGPQPVREGSTFADRFDFGAPGYDFDPMSNPSAIDGEYAALVSLVY